VNSQYYSVTEARAVLGVSWNKMAKLVKSGALPSFSDALDARKTLVRVSDVERLKSERIHLVKEDVA